MPASLTQTAIISRKVIRYGIYFMIFLLVIRTVVNTGIKIYRHFFPEPPPDATVSFGKLPPLPFPVSGGLPRPNLALELTEGQFPETPAQAKVFLMPKPAANLLGLEVAQDRVKAVGFQTESQKLSESTYRFNHKNSVAVLDMNIVNGFFSISYDLAKDPELVHQIPPSSEVAVNLARSYLSNAGVLPDDLSGPTSHEYLVPHEFLELDGTPFVPAESQSVANFVRVNLFRKSYDNLPSLTPNPNRGNVWFIISGSGDKDNQMIAGEYHYLPVNEQQFATYPLKNPQEAWDELVAGGGYIASTGVNGAGEVRVRRAYLAYYDSPESSDFFQPIFVFEGDKGFTAYVPAVSSEFYGD